MTTQMCILGNVASQCLKILSEVMRYACPADGPSSAPYCIATVPSGVPATRHVELNSFIALLAREKIGRTRMLEAFKQSGDYAQNRLLKVLANNVWIMRRLFFR